MYYDVEINEYSPDDVPALTTLWREVFSDEASLIESFFELLPSMGTGLTAKSGGELLGAAYVLCSELWCEDNSRKKLGYIYAVAVDAAARSNGIGAELVRACKRWCWENGIELIATLPAEPSLYAWYSRRAGFSAVGGCTYDTVLASDEPCEITRLDADDYGFRRAEILDGKNYVNLYFGWLAFGEALFSTYGGGYFASGDGIACGCLDGDTLMIKEALSDPPEFIPALCRMLGAVKAIVRRSCPDGEPYLAVVNSADYPPDTHFGLTLD